MFHQLTLLAVPDFPLVEPGNELASMTSDACLKAGIALNDGDVVVIAQKIVSKAEGQMRQFERCDSRLPNRRRWQFSLKRTHGSSNSCFPDRHKSSGAENNVLIVAHRLGYIMANAGIDQSNISHAEGERALLLPIDPDGSAAHIKERLDRTFNIECGVVINDSFGRPWRNGVRGCCDPEPQGSIRFRVSSIGRICLGGLSASPRSPPPTKLPPVRRS